MLEPALIYFTPRSKGFTADMLTAEYTENQARGAAPAAGVAASRVAYGANALASGSQIPMLSPADQVCAALVFVVQCILTDSNRRRCKRSLQSERKLLSLPQ